jgi:hypothetical protein
MNQEKFQALLIKGESLLGIRARAMLSLLTIIMTSTEPCAVSMIVVDQAVSIIFTSSTLLSRMRLAVERYAHMHELPRKLQDQIKLYFTFQHENRIDEHLELMVSDAGHPVIRLGFA